MPAALGSYCTARHHVRKLISTTYTHTTMINPLNNALVLPYTFGQGSRWFGLRYTDLYDTECFTQIIVKNTTTDEYNYVTAGSLDRYVSPSTDWWWHEVSLGMITCCQLHIIIWTNTSYNKAENEVINAEDINRGLSDDTRARYILQIKQVRIIVTKVCVLCISSRFQLPSMDKYILYFVLV